MHDRALLSQEVSKPQTEQLQEQLAAEKKTCQSNQEAAVTNSTGILRKHVPRAREKDQNQ